MKDKNEIRDMVEDELLKLSKIMDVSDSIKKFKLIKNTRRGIKIQFTLGMCLIVLLIVAVILA